MSKETTIEIYYAGQRLNSDKLVHAYSLTLPKVVTQEHFARQPDEKLMLFKSRLIGYEAIGKCIRATRTEKGTKAPYDILDNVKVPKEVIEYWSALTMTDKGRHTMLKESKVKLEGDVEKLIKIIKTYSPSRKHAAIAALLKLL